MLKIKVRKIRNKRLVISGMVYRTIVICANATFFAIGVQTALDKFGTLGASIIWSAINTVLYYLYHFTFARLFKLGEDGE